jgi:hypothetical protein
MNGISSDLHISPMHLVFVERNNPIFPIRALDVVVGDILSAKQVIGIHRNILKTGDYSPLNQSGDIVVSGIVASNYVDVLHFNDMDVDPTYDRSYTFISPTLLLFLKHRHL